LDAKTMLDRATLLIRRQDVTGANRELLLSFMNITRKAVLRDNDITRFYQYLENVTVTNGVVDLSSLNIKSVKSVFYKLASQEAKLHKMDNRESAIKYYVDLTVVGNPNTYFIEGKKLYILPIPATGEINIMAEVWPDDITDSETSSDITTTEIPEVFIYLAAAEYLDNFDEVDKANAIRQKGLILLKQYLAELYAETAKDSTPVVVGYNDIGGRRSAKYNGTYMPSEIDLGGWD
jgi:hypothetical protein